VSERFSHEYPPNEWSTETVERSLRETDEALGIPTYDDADTWSALREDPLTGPAVEELLADAEQHSGEPVPGLRASEYLEFARTGDRYTYQDPEGRRLSRLETFALAECLDREGEYLEDILDYAWAVCEQSTWVVPAHLEGEHDHEGLPGAVDAEDRVVALHSAHVAHLLAEVDYLLGDRLHPALRERIREEVDRRVIEPYLVRDDIWWLSAPMNWNAVCNGATMLAALSLLSDPERQARVVTKGAHSLGRYLAGFDRDGCSPEGINYWNYGFGHYVMAAEALEARTGGELWLLSPSVVREIAAYPLRVELSPGRYVPFSDAEEGSALSAGIPSRLGTRLDHEGLAALGRRAFAEHGPYRDTVGVHTLRDMLWSRDVPADCAEPDPPRATFFGGHEWWLARDDPADPDGLVVAAKGGHNDEPHNHNDCGSFVVHHRGESLLTDLGRPDYDRDYFRNETRYEYLTARSLGHSTPYVADCEQATGRGHAADVVDRYADAESASIDLELADCYPERSGLASLRRTVTLERGDPGYVRITDRAESDPDAVINAPVQSSFESVLVTYFPMDVDGDSLVVTGENARVTVLPGQSDVDLDVERLPDAVKGRDVWRGRVERDSPGDRTEGVELSLTVEVGQRR